MLPHSGHWVSVPMGGCSTRDQASLSVGASNPQFTHRNVVLVDMGDVELAREPSNGFRGAGVAADPAASVAFGVAGRRRTPVRVDEGGRLDREGRYHVSPTA